MKIDPKIKEKLTCGFKYDYVEFGGFSSSHSKVQKLHFNGLFLSKVYEVWPKKYKVVIFYDNEQ